MDGDSPSGPSGVLDRARKQLCLEAVPNAGPKIVQLADRLKNLAETLDVSVSNLLQEHEKDFFLAYKTHMYSIQKEFKVLKEKADEEALKTRRDAKIQSLERELEWFMTEALRLDELCKSHKKEVDRWKAKGEALDEDRRFMEDQIKGAKRQNKVLKAAVDRAQASTRIALKDDSLPPGASASGKVDIKQFKPHKPGQDEKASDLERIAYVDAIRHIKDQLRQEQAKGRLLRSKRAEVYSAKSGLEEFFLQCVDEARKQLTKGKYAPVVESVLSSEEVLVYLYEKLFPHRAGLPDKMRSEQINGQSLGAGASGGAGGAQEHFPAGP